MNLRTEIFIAPFDFRITHHDKILMLGSCFTENISDQLQKSGFQPDINPFGIMYNPVSLSKGIQQLIGGKNYTEPDLFKHKHVFHSWMHHSRFSSTNSNQCLQKINERMVFSSRFLKETSLLIITFGTAYTYTLKSTGKVVANCHQLPESHFQRTRLTVNDIQNEWNLLIQELKQFNPGLKILFTISPIRHWKDGLHDNQLSKSTLLLAVDELVRQHAHCYYFPSYELLLDDLRDYRFYNDDMVHPAPLAIEYIWDKFSQAFFDSGTAQLISEWKKIRDALSHKPFHPESEEYLDFFEKTRIKLELFYKQHPEFIPNKITTD